jgi:phenylalanyl-tRNA synthetase beta chain
MMNNLSADLDIMRPSMLETVLETVSFNINRRNKNLRLFEFGKTYHSETVGKYTEEKHLVMVVTGATTEMGWRSKEKAADLFYLKGVLNNLLKMTHAGQANSEGFHSETIHGIRYTIGNEEIATIGEVSRKRLQTFDIKQPVWFAAIRGKNS